MEGRTHVTVGIASALVILRPQTIPGVLCTIAGSLFGSIICDLDHFRKREAMNLQGDKYSYQKVVYGLIIAAVFMLLDYYAGDGASAYVMNHWNATTLFSVMAFFFCWLFGMTTSHRTFMHSFLAGTVFSGTLWYACRPLAYPFATGFLSHIVLDLLNQKKIRLLWPLPYGFCLGMFPSDGKLNSFLEAVGMICSVYLASFFAVKSFINSSLSRRMTSFFLGKVNLAGLMDIPMYVLYFLVINAFTFFVYWLNGTLLRKHKLIYAGGQKHAREMEDFMKPILLLPEMAGGIIGKYLYVFYSGKDCKRDANSLVVFPVCLAVIWSSVYCLGFRPEIIRNLRGFMNTSTGVFTYREIFIAAFLLLNFVVFEIFRKSQRYTLAVSKENVWMVVLCVIGGASGGLIAGNLAYRHHISFQDALTEMTVTHAVVLACLLI